MSNWRVYFWIGGALFLLGGGVLAYWEHVEVGTTLGLAGVGLMAWAWIRRQSGPDS